MNFDRKELKSKRFSPSISLCVLEEFHLIGRFEYNNVFVLLCVIFLTCMCCPRLCSQGGWLLLKCSALGIGAETNCGIARILGILLMNSWDTQIYFLATTIICNLSYFGYKQIQHRIPGLFHVFTYDFFIFRYIKSLWEHRSW